MTAASLQTELSTIAERLLELAETVGAEAADLAEDEPVEVADEDIDIDDEDEPAEETDIDSMSRKELAPIAQSLGIDTKGRKVQALRQLIREKQANGGPAKKASGLKKGPGRPKKALLAKKKEPSRAEILQQFIGNNYADYEEAVGETGMACEGKCTDCPNPDEYDTVEEQLNSCWEAIKDDMK